MTPKQRKHNANSLVSLAQYMHTKNRGSFSLSDYTTSCRLLENLPSIPKWWNDSVWDTCKYYGQLYYSECYGSVHCLSTLRQICFAPLCRVQFLLLPTPPGICHFFLHLASYSPPPGTKIEAIPHPRDTNCTVSQEYRNIMFYKIDVDSYGSCKGQETSPIVFVSRLRFFGF